jgi:transmembrane sensor
MEQDINREIDDVAAAWLARADRGPLSPADQAAFDSWLEASPLHRGAYARLEALFTLVDKADLDLSSVSQSRIAPGLARLFEVSRRKALWLGGGAIAAGVAAHFVTTSPLNFETYQTARGEVRAVPLQDGTVVTLNTASKVAVRFKRSAREVQLLEGEALFDVAKDPKRPFTVAAGSTVVRAVGTSFLVRDLDDQPLEVLVREGAVDMFRAPDFTQAPAPDQTIRVNANSRAVALDVPYPSVKLVNVGLDPSVIARQLAWRSGMISFEDESLKNAAIKFSRYSDVRIVIDDPEVAAKTVTGLFSIYNPEGFARSVALSLNLQISVTPAGVMLWR